MNFLWGGVKKVDFNPQDSKNISICSAINIAIACSFRTGMLWTPYAFKCSGYAVGIMLALLMNLVARYGLILLVTSSNKLCIKKKVAYLSLAESLKAAFEDYTQIPVLTKVIARFVDTLLVSLQFGIMTIYYFFAVSMTSEVLDLTGHIWGFTAVAVFLTPYFFFAFWLRSLNQLGWFLFIHNVLSLFSIISVVYLLFQGVTNFKEPYSYKEYRSVHGFFGIYSLAIESFGAIISLEQQIQKPWRLVKPLGILSMITPFALCTNIFIGVMGYFQNGDTVRVIILRCFPSKNYLVVAVKVSFIISTIISYSLEGHGLITTVWTNLFKKQVTSVENHFLYEMFIRNVIVILTCAVSIGWPSRRFEILLLIVGGTIKPLVLLFFPALLHLMVFFNEEKTGKLDIRILVDVCIMAAGSFLCTTTIVRIFQKLQKQNNPLLDPHVKENALGF